MALQQLEKIEHVAQPNHHGRKIVTAKGNDPKGFSPYYQENLNTRIIASRMAEVLGPIPAEDVIPPSSYGMMRGPSRARGVIQTEITPNLVTSSDPNKTRREQ